MSINNKNGDAVLQRTGRADCVSCSLRNSMLFASLDEETLARISMPIDQLHLPARGVLYLEQASGAHVFTIRKGLIKLVQHTEGGQPRIVRLLRRGDVAGLEILLDGKYRHTAEAVSDSDVCRIPAPVIQRMEDACSAIYDSVLERMQRSLDAADTVITRLSSGTARMRVANFLLMVSCRDNGSECDYLSREDIASLLGLTVETVSRVFARFKREGYVQEKNNCFQIDENALQAIVEA